MKSLYNSDGTIKKIVIILPIFFLIFLGIYLYLNVSFNKDYIIVSEKLILQKKAGKYHKVSEVPKNITDKKYTVVADKTYKNVSLKYDEGFYYLNDNYQDLNLQNVSLAYTSNYHPKAANYNFAYFSDSDINYLKELTNDYQPYINSLAKVSYDFDGDHEKETIYTANTSDFGSSTGSIKTLFFMVKDHKIYQVFDKKSSNIYYVIGIDDLDNNGKYELIVSKGITDNPTFDSKYQIYSMQNKKFKLIMEE